MKSEKKAANKKELPQPEGSRATIETFKNHPILVLDADAPFPFRFGVGKAKMILEHLDTIQFFVKQHGKEKKEVEA